MQGRCAGGGQLTAQLCDAGNMHMSGLLTDHRDMQRSCTARDQRHELVLVSTESIAFSLGVLLSTLTLSARFSSQSPSEKVLKSPVLLGLSGGLVGGLDGPWLLLEPGPLDADGACAAALKALARC